MLVSFNLHVRLIYVLLNIYLLRPTCLLIVSFWLFCFVFWTLNIITLAVKFSLVFPLQTLRSRADASI